MHSASVRPDAGPPFVAGLRLAAGTDYVLTLSERAAQALAGALGLRLIEPPLPLSPCGLHLLWHPRLKNEPANQWLREVFIRATREAVPDDRPHVRGDLERVSRRRGGRAKRPDP